MNATDERLERYLHDRSSTIDLPHAGVDAITRRARRHRRRRTAAVGGVAAAVLLGGTAIALRQPAPDEEVGSLGSSVVESPLEWSVVPVRAGLGWGSGAVSDGTAVYSLSTAAGPEHEGNIGEPRRLYRSDDGTDWEDVGLPEGLYTSGVAATDGSIYAVGTAAAGGETVGVELAVSSDGGEGWDTDAVPLDVAAIGDGFPGRVRTVDAEVAATGGTTVVAVSVAGAVDPAAVLPEADAPAQWWQTEGGMTRPLDTCEVVTEQPGETTTAPVSTTVPPTTAPPAAPADGADPAVDASGGGVCEGGVPETETRTWAELGLTPEQAAVAEGQTHLFVADPDGALEPVEILAGAGYANPSSSSLLAADDGWWLVSDETSERDDAGYDASTDVVARHSTDGRTWAVETLATDQATLATGVVDGRPVLVGLSQGTGEQRAFVHRIEAGGGVTTTDLNALLDLPVSSGVFGYGVGPLGVAVVMGGLTGGPDDDLEVISSLDGLQFSRQTLPAAEPGTKESVNGITITPDAVKVRLNVRDEGDLTGGEPAAQRLFVGTPAG